MDGSLSEKADVIREALRRLSLIEKLQISQVVMVGDTRFDILGARELGMECLAVSFGYGPRQELEEAAPIAIADDPEGILDFFG